MLLDFFMFGPFIVNWTLILIVAYKEIIIELMPASNQSIFIVDLRDWLCGYVAGYVCVAISS